MSSDYIVGIDLGTTNSLVAYMQGDTPVVIPGEDGLNLQTRIRAEPNKIEPSSNPVVPAFAETYKNILMVNQKLTAHVSSASPNRKAAVASQNQRLGRHHGDLTSSPETTSVGRPGSGDQSLIPARSAAPPP